jgi:hypothetical protein
VVLAASIPTVQVQFSFLVGGPQLVVPMPPEFDGTPELSSPLINGVGPRSFDFVPLTRRDGAPQGYTIIQTFSDPAGRRVELYTWPYDAPPQWFLRWLVTNGSVWTHLREEDTPALAAAIVLALNVVESDETGTPFLLPNPPMRSAVSSRPGYQEFATFFSQTRPDWRVTLQRPGYLPEGEVRVLPEGVRDWILVRRGLSDGIEALVRGDDLQEAVDIAAVMAPISPV